MASLGPAQGNPKTPLLSSASTVSPWAPRMDQSPPCQCNWKDSEGPEMLECYKLAYSVLMNIKGCAQFIPRTRWSPHPPTGGLWLGASQAHLFCLASPSGPRPQGELIGLAAQHFLLICIYHHPIYFNKPLVHGTPLNTAESR